MGVSDANVVVSPKAGISGEPPSKRPLGSPLLQLLGNGYIEFYDARLLFHIVSRLNLFFEFVRKRLGWGFLT